MCPISGGNGAWHGSDNPSVLGREVLEQSPRGELSVHEQPEEDRNPSNHKSYKHCVKGKCSTLHHANGVLTHTSSETRM